MTSRNIDILNICFIIVMWVALAILVNPIGDFPLNDDWAYGWSVKTLLETGSFQLSDWSAVNLFSQTLWGALFCVPFGFSFTALRFSTLTLGLIGLIGTYGLLREVKASAQVSLIGAAIIALNPIYFGLSHSFMSDVPSFTFIIVSFYFFMRALERDCYFDFLIGLVASFIAILNRQTGLMVLPAFGLAYLVNKGFKVRNLPPAVLPGILGLVLYLSYSWWLKITGRASHSYNSQTQLLLESLSSGLVNVLSVYAANTVTIAIYLGLFLLPFLILNFAGSTEITNIWHEKRKHFLIIMVVCITALLAVKYSRLPSVGNILEVFGIGPSSISRPPMGSYGSSTVIHRIWQFLTVLGVAGVALLLLSFWRATRQACSQNGDKKLNRSLALTSAAICLYVLPIGALPKGSWFDRYLLVLLPLLMVLVSISTASYVKNKTNLPTTIFCVAMLLAYGWFTISATHDYLSWNRVRWQAVSHLLQHSRISPADVDGGGAFRGWHYGNKLKTCNPAYQANARKKEAIKWNDFTCLSSKGDEKFSVSLVGNTGYQIERRYSFRRWLFFKDQDVYILRRNTFDE